MAVSWASKQTLPKPTLVAMMTLPPGMMLVALDRTASSVMEHSVVSMMSIFISRTVAQGMLPA
jgi:hypothetical protein